MNNSGAAVHSIAAFYRIAPAEILVVHDEIDLPPGVARLKQGGGHGGHNGVRDVIAQLGADFWRCGSVSGIRATRTRSSTRCWTAPRLRSNS